MTVKPAFLMATFTAAGLAFAPASAIAQAESAANAPCKPRNPAALGLTIHELSDADLVSAQTGAELGEVERVVLGADCNVSGLVIEIENTEPDGYVEIPLAGLTAVRAGDDWLLETVMTRGDLLALPPLRYK